MTIVQVFIRFLKYNNLLYIYKENIKENINLNIYISSYFLDNSLNWGNTKQGHSFWSDIDDVWCDLLYDSELDEKYGSYKLTESEIIEFFLKLKYYKIT